MEEFNINDIKLDSLSSLIQQAQEEVRKTMLGLSVEDRAKVEAIMNSVDKNSSDSIMQKTAELEVELKNLNKDKDA